LFFLLNFLNTLTSANDVPALMYVLRYCPRPRHGVLIMALDNPFVTPV